MKKLFFISLLFFGISILLVSLLNKPKEWETGAPPYGEALEDVPNLDPFTRFRDWKRPEGPPKVGLQVGHWKSNELPDELARLRNNTGSSGGGKWEWEVNMQIAQTTKELLEMEGIVVEILPATIPPEYWADVFVSIHADGSTDRTKTGYKIAGPWRDLTNNSLKLVTSLEESYEKYTGLVKDPNITRNMRGYYAFSWWRYDHAIHPMTTAAIVETGFLTSPSDQRLIIRDHRKSSTGIAEGISNYLISQQLLK